MLCVYGDGYILGHYSASSASSHDCYKDIAWRDGVASKLVVFLLRDVAPFSPTEFICYSIVDAQHGNAGIDELGMKQLTSKWAGADIARQRRNGMFWPSFRTLLNKRPTEDRMRQTIKQVEGAFALGAQRIGFVQDRRDPSLLVKWREGNTMFEEFLPIDVFHRGAVREPLHFVDRRIDCM